MHLEKRFVKVKQIVFGDECSFRSGVLTVNRDELKELCADFRFESVDFEIANPGESCRITYVCDCVQPVFKLGENASTFPGVVDEIRRVGSGQTVVLQGMGVTEVSLIPTPNRNQSMLDLSGPATEESLVLPKLIHLCVLAKPGEGVKNNDFFSALNTASKKLAKYLASLAADAEPDEVQVYEKLPCTDPSLPKVAYIFQIFSHAPLTDTLYYGDGCATMMPIIVQPNEVLDGALVYRDYYQINNASPTLVLQNHPMILELLRRHNKDINFMGVIMSNTPAEVENKKRNAMMCAGLAKYVFGADCAIISKEGGGHPQIDVGLNCDACEELGIKTVLLLSEFLSAGNPIAELVLFSTENANAMVTNGGQKVLEYPHVDRVIGLKTMTNRPRTGTIDAYGPFQQNAYLFMRDAANQIGNTDLTTVLY